MNEAMLALAASASFGAVGVAYRSALRDEHRGLGRLVVQWERLFYPLEKEALHRKLWIMTALGLGGGVVFGMRAIYLLAAALRSQ